MSGDPAVRLGVPAARRAKIVATLGPSTDGLEADLVAAGLEQNIAVMEAHLLGHCGVHPGQTVVIVGSHPFKKRMHTNFVKYQVLRAP